MWNNKWKARAKAAERRLAQNREAEITLVVKLLDGTVLFETKMYAFKVMSDDRQVWTEGDGSTFTWILP